MRTFLDTHAWVWWVTEDRRLSARVRSLIERLTEKEGVWISAISIWEVAKKVEKKQLLLNRPLRQWLDSATTTPGLFMAELTPGILIESCNLPQPFHGDPADQIIVATVRNSGGRLVTKDRRLRDYPHIVVVW